MTKTMADTYKSIIIDMERIDNIGALFEVKWII